MAVRDTQLRLLFGARHPQPRGLCENMYPHETPLVLYKALTIQTMWSSR